MKTILFISASFNVLFLLMHELDAVYRKEWRMFKFMSNLKEKTQCQIFLYLHFPLFAFLIYYLITVFNFNNISLWIIINSLSVIHFIIHLYARKWKSNVFQSGTSFLFIGGAGITGVANLILTKYY